MKLTRVEQAFDGSRLVFYFTADGRVDFRELVRELAAEFRTRIEMRQIGVRDEAKMHRRLRHVRPAALLHDVPAVLRADLDQDGEAAGSEPQSLEAVGALRPAEVLPALRAAERQGRACTAAAAAKAAATTRRVRRRRLRLGGSCGWLRVRAASRQRTHVRRRSRAQRLARPSCVDGERLRCRSPAWRSRSAIRRASGRRSRRGPPAIRACCEVCEPVLYAPPAARVRARRPERRRRPRRLRRHRARRRRRAARGRRTPSRPRPINKEAFRLAGLPWSGHTDLLAHLTGASTSR